MVLKTEKTVGESRAGNKKPGVERADRNQVAHLIEQLKQRTVELEEANRELRHVSRTIVRSFWRECRMSCAPR